MLRLEALTDQVIGAGENAVEGNLGIQGAPTPEHTVLQNGGEGRLVPLILVDWHHIVVGHQYRRISGGFSRPTEKQSPVGKLLKFTDLENLGIQCGQQLDELFKFCLILQGMVIVGNGFAP